MVFQTLPRHVVTGGSDVTVAYVSSHTNDVMVITTVMILVMKPIAVSQIIIVLYGLVAYTTNETMSFVWIQDP